MAGSEGPHRGDDRERDGRRPRRLSRRGHERLHQQAHRSRHPGRGAGPRARADVKAGQEAWREVRWLGDAEEAGVKGADRRGARSPMILDGAPVLDNAVLADLRASVGDDQEFMVELVETYVTE